MVPVFRIKRWNSVSEHYELSLHKYTIERIKQIAKEDFKNTPIILRDSRQEVNPAEIDKFGCYDPERGTA